MVRLEFAIRTEHSWMGSVRLGKLEMKKKYYDKHFCISLEKNICVSNLEFECHKCSELRTWSEGLFWHNSILWRSGNKDVLIWFPLRFVINFYFAAWYYTNSKILKNAIILQTQYLGFVIHWKFTHRHCAY